MLLLRELWASGSFWLCPFFSCYVAALCIYYPLWNPYWMPMQQFSEPILLALKVCAALEAYMLATESVSCAERKALLGTLLGIACAGMLVTFGFVNGAPLTVIRQYAHVALALASCFGVLAMWVYPPMIWPRVRNHGITLAVYFVNFAVTGFLPRITGADWLVTSSCFFAGSLICVGLWLWRGLLVSQPPERVHCTTEL